jgi:hypothetical protein
MTLRLPKATAQPNDFRQVILLLGGFSQAFGFTEVSAGLFELICTQLIFGKLCQISRQKKYRVSLFAIASPHVETTKRRSFPVFA